MLDSGREQVARADRRVGDELTSAAEMPPLSEWADDDRRDGRVLGDCSRPDVTFSRDGSRMLDSQTKPTDSSVRCLDAVGTDVPWRQREWTGTSGGDETAKTVDAGRLRVAGPPAKDGAGAAHTASRHKQVPPIASSLKP